MLEGELTMEKWDKLAMLLQDQGLAEFLNNIYSNMDGIKDLKNNMKTILLNIS